MTGSRRLSCRCLQDGQRRKVERGGPLVRRVKHVPLSAVTFANAIHRPSLVPIRRHSRSAIHPNAKPPTLGSLSPLPPPFSQHHPSLLICPSSDTHLRPSCSQFTPPKPPLSSSSARTTRQHALFLTPLTPLPSHQTTHAPTTPFPSRTTPAAAAARRPNCVSEFSMSPSSGIRQTRPRSFPTGQGCSRLASCVAEEFLEAWLAPCRRWVVNEVDDDERVTVVVVRVTVVGALVSVAGSKRGELRAA